MGPALKRPNENAATHPASGQLSGAGSPPSPLSFPTGCLSNVDIDGFLRLTHVQASSETTSSIPANLFYLWQRGQVDNDFVSRTINRAIASSTPDAAGEALFVAYFRHHWIVMKLRGGADGRTIEIWDSAPSPMVARDLLRLCRSFNWPRPLFHDSPRQARDSNQCGLFALATIVLLRAGYELGGVRTLCLEPLRTCLSSAERFLDTALSLYGISNPATSHAISGSGTDSPDDSRPPDSTDIPMNGPDTRCIKHTQAKRGGHRCSEPAVHDGLCRLHLLLAHTGESKCPFIAKTGRPCTHHVVEGLKTCVFHVDDASFTTWLQRLRSTTAQQQPSTTEVDTSTSTSQQPAVADPILSDIVPPSLDDALALVDNPDFEARVGELAAAPAGIFDLPPQSSHTHVLRIDLEGTFGSGVEILRQSKPSDAHPLALRAWKRATWLDHARALRHLTDDQFNQSLTNLPFIRGLLQYFTTSKQKRKWKWTTMLRNMATLQGAMAKIPLARNVMAVDLSQSAEWQAALRFVASQARSEKPKVPIAATAQQVKAAMAAEPRRAVRLLLAMTWACCGRTGDILQLGLEDVQWITSTTASPSITTTFRRGKTIERRGPYSLHTSLPAEWFELLDLKPGDPDSLAAAIKVMHRAEVKDVLAALRRVAPELENRSLRRGALQTLAKSGVSEDTLLLFSGHSLVATLRRYLAWGSIGSDKQTKMLSASTALHGAGSTRFSHQPYAPVITTYLRQLPPTYDEFLATTPLWDVRRSNASSNNVDPYFSSPNATSSNVCHGYGSPHNRWMEFIGVEAPPIEVLPGYRQDHNASVSELPLHSKDVLPSANTDMLINMCNDPELRSYASDTFTWLSDPRKYEELLANQEPTNRGRTKAKCALSPEDVEVQLRLGKYTLPRLSRKAARAWCRVFTVPELSKQRRRHICEPLLNDHFTKTPTLHFASKDTRHRLFGRMKNGFGVTLDYSSCFDQYGLKPSVQPFFAIRLPDGRISTMNVMPMGFRPSAAIGQSGTWCICDVSHLFPRLRVGVDYVILTYIDNILVLGITENITRQVTSAIIERSLIAGLRFNEHHPPLSPTWCPEPSQKFEFLGEHVDLTTGSVSQSQKTLHKVLLVDINTHMTKRQLAAVIGLFLFASSCCGTRNDRHHFFHALRFYRQNVQWQHGCEPQWDTPISTMSDVVLKNFQEWQRHLMFNTPLPTPANSPSPQPTDLLFVDASVERWAAVHIPSNAPLRIHSGDWSAADHREWKLESSVCSEPLGIRRALCKAITPSPKTCVMVYTDHSGVVDAVAAPCAICYSYWKLQSFLASFPARVLLRHIPGVSNPADSFTRGPVDLSLEHDPTWQALVGKAQLHHADAQHAIDDGEDGVTATATAEWLDTARNPWRDLLIGSRCHATPN